MKSGRRPVDPARVAVLYQHALADEAKVLALWPGAREYKKKNVSDLSFSPGAKKAIEDYLKKLQTPSQDLIATADWYPQAHRNAMAESIPDLFNYRPSNLILSNLQVAWMPYAELLLEVTAELEGEDVSALKLRLKDLGFAVEILDFFRLV
jgi:hypothetical protein